MMADYEPLDLVSYCNSDCNILGNDIRAPLGKVDFHGLPFLVGEEKQACFIGMGEGLRTEPLEISFNN